MTLHAMIDLETLATTDDAAITQIGLVFFNEGGPLEDVEHEWVLDPTFQTDRRVDADTMRWHLDDRLRIDQLKRSYSTLGKLPWRALEELVRTIVSHRPKLIWAKSPSFDLRILAHAMREHRIADLPWGFWQERDVRTAFDFLELATGEKPALKKTHRAIDDAYEQAEWVAKALRLAGSGRAVDDITREPIAS